MAYGVCRRGGIASERLGARLSVAGRAVQYWSIAGERPVKARLSVTGRACVRGCWLVRPCVVTRVGVPTIRAWDNLIGEDELHLRLLPVD